jgi:DNA-binding IclR family transcriptional regulator
MATVLESNKTKIAKRVIEVFEYFGEDNRKATVMDIVRRYGRPQSSTSELLASLVEMGLLYKDAASRSYSPTPRLATFGMSAQPDILRGGRLYPFMDRLAQSTRHGVALFGMVGTHTQIFRWSPGAAPLAHTIENGASERLSSSTAGLLLLSTLGAEPARKLLWRLNAEAPPEERFDHSELSRRVASYAGQGWASGESGFMPGVKLTAVLLPCGADERPLALGVVYPDDRGVDPEALVATLRHGIVQCTAAETLSPSSPSATLMRAV